MRQILWTLGTVLAALLLPSCGIVTAPLSVPEAIAKNADFSLRGVVVDPSGKPLENVILAQELGHYFWTADGRGKTTNEQTIRLVNGRHQPVLMPRGVCKPPAPSPLPAPMTNQIASVACSERKKGTGFINSSWPGGQTPLPNCPANPAMPPPDLSTN